MQAVLTHLVLLRHGSDDVDEFRLVLQAIALRYLAFQPVQVHVTLLLVCCDELSDDFTYCERHTLGRRA